MTEDNRQKEIRLKKELAQVKAMNANACLLYTSDAADEP